LDAGGDKLVPLLEFAFGWIVQLGDAIGGVAGFRYERIVDMEEHVVIRTDVELLEDVRSLLVSKVGG